MKTQVSFWKKAPVVRLLIPLIVGIILQWYFRFPPKAPGSILVLSTIIFITQFFLPYSIRYTFAILNGIVLNIICITIGSLLIWHQDIRNNAAWFAKSETSNPWIIRVDEPLIEKPKSFKCIVSVMNAKGKVIIYFKKDTALKHIKLGSIISFSKPFQEIKNFAGFDYKRYCLFQNITHQVYLQPKDYILTEENIAPPQDKILYWIREKVISILRKYIPGEKEQGLAEALLIGYKHDLDRDLVQSYSNTGVVHVIAISGLHLGLIYLLLVQLLRPLRKKFKWPVAFIIIASLWLFSLLAGAQPSVLRSALMFSCIVLAETMSRKTSIYNTLALSAFILLCINPFWLWDIGFQLSYSAVLSIVVFMKPVYNLIYIKNKLLDSIWKLNSVTIAAQLLTTPLSIYHFHQFPNYFLLSNFVAVPLSSAVVLGEIFLCAVSFIPALALITGKLLYWMIRLMNSFIEKVAALPGSLWKGIDINIAQAVLLTIIVVIAGRLLLEKR